MLTFNGGQGFQIGPAFNLSTPGGGHWPTKTGLPGGTSTDFWVRVVQLTTMVDGSIQGDWHTFVGHGGPGGDPNGDQITGYLGASTTGKIVSPPYTFPPDAAPLFTDATDYLDVHVGCPPGDSAYAWLSIWWVPSSQ